MFNIKVARVPGTVKEVTLQDGATVNDALAAANEALQSGEAIRLNGIETTGTASVKEGDRVVLVRGAKGN